MFCPVLRYLEAYVALVDYTLLHSVYFVPEHESIASALLGLEVLKFDTAFHLLEAA